MGDVRIYGSSSTTSQNDYDIKKEEVAEDAVKPVKVEKEKPNYGLSGLLAEAAQVVVGGIKIKYSEPPEKATPSRARWTIFIYKGKEDLGSINLFNKSYFLFGKESKIVDVLIEHPSCSKQHAVIQFRSVGEKKKKIRYV